MSARKQHLDEMRYALAHNVSLPEAKRRLARRRQLEADEFLEQLQNCGTAARPARRDPDTILGRGLGPVEQPWMMRD